MPHGRLPLSVTNHSLLLGCLPQAITSWSMPHGRMPLAITNQSMPQGRLPLSVLKKSEYAAWTLATFLVSLKSSFQFVWVGRQGFVRYWELFPLMGSALLEELSVFLMYVALANFSPYASALGSVYFYAPYFMRSDQFQASCRIFNEKFTHTLAC